MFSRDKKTRRLISSKERFRTSLFCARAWQIREGNKHCATERKDGPSRGISSCSLGHSLMSEGDRIRVPMVGRAQIKGDSSRTPSWGEKLQGSALRLGSGQRSAIKAAAVSQHPQPPPTPGLDQSQPGVGGEATQRGQEARARRPGAAALEPVLPVPAAGERPAEANHGWR